MPDVQPVTAYPLIEELCGYRDWPAIPGRILHKPFSFYLDSAAVNFPGARYSYLGCNPFLIFACSGSCITITQNTHQEILHQDPFIALKKLFYRFKLMPPDQTPPFLGGAVGYFGYDLARVIESLPVSAADDIALPDCCLGFYSTVIIIDHLQEKVLVASSGFPETRPAWQQKLAQRDINELKTALSLSPVHDASVCKMPAHTAASEVTATFDRAAYCRAIQVAKSYIEAGDIYQVNLSQRFRCRLPENPLAIYMRLRRISPAPFAGFFHGADYHVLSSSPERFLRLSGSLVETRPIKGTRPRGPTTAEDQRLLKELQASEKDRAELIMIVDLERNDLGRVCRYGTIFPKELIRIETHPVVHHLVATIKGELTEGSDHIDCLRACFPGGSITGAPKIRAMEIIEELEPCRRKIYTGSFGYLGFNGETDLNILIRTIVHINGTFYFNVGGGIVADSDPEMEYDETMHKGKGIMQALGIITDNSWKTRQHL